MVKQKKIKITINKDGNIELEPLNAEGSECLDWTKEIEESIGEVEKRTHKDSFYQEAEGTNHVDSTSES